MDVASLTSSSETVRPARVALQRAGIPVLAEREVLLQRLNQAIPGQLGELAEWMGKAGVNIEVQYSDHDGQLVLVVDDPQKGRAVSNSWMAKRLS